MKIFVKPQRSARLLGRRSPRTVMASWCALVIVVLFMTSFVAASEIHLVLTVHDANGDSVPNFEAMLHTYHEGYIPWQSGKEGRIHFGSKGILTLNLIDDPQYQVIVRAPDLAPAIMHLECTEYGYDEKTVTLAPGRLIELSVTTADGRPVPKDITPLVVFTDFEGRVRSTRQPENMRPGHVDDFEMSKVRCVDNGRYQFRIPDDAPPFFLSIDHPGFMRSVETNVMNEDELADGRIEWRLPTPAKLHVRFDPPGADVRPRYDYSLVRLGSKAAEIAPYYTIWLQQYDDLGFDVTLDDLPPSHYWLSFRLVPPEQENLGSGTNGIARYWDRVMFDLNAGERKTINLAYEPFDPNSWRGNSTATVTVHMYNGEPAAGMSYILSYMVPHYNYIVVEQGNLDDQGRFRLENVHPGPEGPEFYLKVDDEQLGRMQMTEKSNQNFKFTLAPRLKDQAPDVSFIDLETSQPVSLRTFQGQFVYLEFWATWCGPCQTPMAKLNKILKRRHADWDKHVAVLAVSLDDSQDIPYRYAQQRGWISVRHLWAGDDSHRAFEGPAAKKFGITGIPTAVLIDHRGAIVWRGHPKDRNCETQIDELLKTMRTEL
jgi:thiol-disulfide isomerase/thioredoxin